MTYEEVLIKYFPQHFHGWILAIGYFEARYYMAHYNK